MSKQIFFVLVFLFMFCSVFFCVSLVLGKGVGCDWVEDGYVSGVVRVMPGDRRQFDGLRVESMRVVWKGVDLDNLLVGNESVGVLGGGVITPEMAGEFRGRVVADKSFDGRILNTLSDPVLVFANFTKFRKVCGG